MSMSVRASAAPVSVLFFLSGTTGLSYEVIWFKQFSHVWGTSTLAMASVVGAFLLGLGLGARAWGPIADRVVHPVYWYGLCEIGIGLLALIIPWETSLLWNLSVSYYASLRDYPAWYALLRCATTFAVIGPPCILMGGTLPLLVRHLASRDGLGQATGWLYGINTLGAALGCYVVGFHLLPEFGLAWTNIGTACANIAVGLVAIGLGWRGSEDRAAEDRDRKSEVSPNLPAHSPSLQGEAGGVALHGDSTIADKSNPNSPPWLVYAIAALAGCAALILQTVWNRQLALVLGSSTYAFSAMLFVVLAGIGLGSLVFRAFVVKYADDPSTLLYIVAATILSTVAGMWLVPFAADCAGVAVPLRASYATNAFVCIAGSALVEFFPAMAMGILFPCLVHQANVRQSHHFSPFPPRGGRAGDGGDNLPGMPQNTLTPDPSSVQGEGRKGSVGDASAGRIVGNVYACNTLGTLIGGIAASVWLIPIWGTHVAVLVALVLYIVIAALASAFAAPATPSLCKGGLGWAVEN